jgi:hypothetical protein
MSDNTSQDEQYAELQRIYLDWHHGKRPLSGYIHELDDYITAHYTPKTEQQETLNRARHELHSILTTDVDNELDHSDIEERFNQALDGLRKSSNA